MGAIRKIIDRTKLEKCVLLETRIFTSKVDNNILNDWLLVELQPYMESSYGEDQEALNTSAVKTMYRRWLEDQFMFADVRIVRARKKGTPADADKLQIGALFRVTMLGAEHVGKSQLLNQVVKGFDPSFFESAYDPTIGVSFGTLYSQFRASSGAPPAPKTCKLEIWDTSGQERFATICQAYIRGTHIIMLCFDLCDRSSFSALAERIMPMLSSVVYGDLSRFDVIVVGCKLDLAETQRQVSESEARQYALSLGDNVDYMECSSRTCRNVHRLFMAAARKHYLRCEDQYSYLHIPAPPKQAKEKDSGCIVC
jgi:small GTP-binding protein